MGKYSASKFSVDREKQIEKPYWNTESDIKPDSLNVSQMQFIDEFAIVLCRWHVKLYFKTMNKKVKLITCKGVIWNILCLIAAFKCYIIAISYGYVTGKGV